MLVFDEVITGFRLGLGGAQALYGVTPDLTVLGKALGAGLPIGAVCGTRAAMRPIADGRLMHRGTFNGNPLCVAAAIASLRTLRAGEAEIYPRMERFAATLATHFNAEAGRLGIAACAQQIGPVLQLFTGVRALNGLGDLARADRDGILHLTGALLCRGIQAIPRGLMYLSAAHTEAEIDLTMHAMTGALQG
jgi:glutamate-1-semialdehyde 2,1-aminomutase